MKHLMTGAAAMLLALCAVTTPDAWADGQNLADPVVRNPAATSTPTTSAPTPSRATAYGTTTLTRTSAVQPVIVPRPPASPAIVAAPAASLAPVATSAPRLDLGAISFQPTRRPDGTCCPPPPTLEPREDPCQPLDPCAPIDPCVSPFSLSLGLGLALSQGNSDKFDITFSGTATYERRPWLVRLSWLRAYGESSGTASTDAFHSDLVVERRVQGPWSVFGAVSFDNDEIADLQYRWIGNLGVGYRFFEYKGTYLKGEVGAGYTIEKRRFRAETSDPSGYLGVEYMRAFRNGIDLSASARFLPNLDDSDLSLLVLEAELAVPLTVSSSLAITARVDHVFDAPEPAENTDVIISAGIKIDL